MLALAAVTAGAQTGDSLIQLKAAAEAGDPAAQTSMAQRDSAQAESWYRKAAAQDYAPAEGKLGNILIMRASMGIGLNPETQAVVAREALKWTGLAASQGDHQGQSDLAQVCYQGKWVKQDLVAAYQWSELASQGVPYQPYAIMAQTVRDAAILKMTAKQLAEGKRRVAEFKPRAAGKPTVPATTTATNSNTGLFILGDDEMECYLGQSDLVVVGEITTPFHDFYRPGAFKVTETIKGEPQETVVFGYDHGTPGPNIVIPNGPMVLFLWRLQTRGSTNLEPFWRPRDVRFGAMPAIPTLVASLKRIAASQAADSGETQFYSLLRRIAPHCTLLEEPYKIGEQAYSSAVLTGLPGGNVLDRREMKWVADSHWPQTNNLTYLHCPKLAGDFWELSNVKTARDAEDYVRLMFGFCAGPRALANWTVKAEPLDDSWLVTPTYIGASSPARTVGAMKLIYMNRAMGKVMDIQEWRPDFQPGQTARQMRPTSMNSDGLDPAPAEMDDPTLDFYLSRCKSVVVGNLTRDLNGGFFSGMALHNFGGFNVTEFIKGPTTNNTTIHVEIVQRGMTGLKKDEKLVLFLNDNGAKTRNGTEWETAWSTDDLDFGVMTASPNLVGALKRLALKQETPVK